MSSKPTRDAPSRGARVQAQTRAHGHTVQNVFFHTPHVTTVVSCLTGTRSSQSRCNRGVTVSVSI